jgi:hypothetical protein
MLSAMDPDANNALGLGDGCLRIQYIRPGNLRVLWDNGRDGDQYADPDFPQAKREVVEIDMSNLRWSIAACVFLALTASASAQTSSTRVGGLTCETSARLGLLVGSRQRMRCVFRSNTGQTYHYTGTITRLGFDVGVTGGGRLFWGVFAPSSHIGPGALRGNFVGASGNASLGLGLGANVLVGGSSRTISLQPLSVEGQVGINLALGVAGLRLR